MSILVSRAGYIGSMLVRQLLSDGLQVRVVDVLPSGGESIIDLLDSDAFEFARVDVCVEEPMQEAADGMDAVVHLPTFAGDLACAVVSEVAKSIS